MGVSCPTLLTFSCGGPPERSEEGRPTAATSCWAAPTKIVEAGVEPQVDRVMCLAQQFEPSLVHFAAARSENMWVEQSSWRHPHGRISPLRTRSSNVARRATSL